MWALFYLRKIALNFFSLSCSSFLRIKVCKKGTQVIKAECFFACAISREVKRKIDGILHNIPEQNCIGNLERLRKFTFNQNTNVLYPRSPSDKRSRATVMINRGDLLL